tara:strand:- start:131039 stop:135454 length:4416 start_codon:yes stop_codon:yes gene_type:complete
LNFNHCDKSNSFTAMCEKSLTKSIKFLLFFTSLILLSNGLKAQIQADFSSDTTSGCGSITVNFSNTSNVSGSAYNFEWDFGNGNSSILENPSATYSSAGSYGVRLIVSNTSGTERDTVLKTNYVTIFDPPNADFSFSPSGGCSPITVNFTNSSTAGDAPIISNRWVFADGSQPFFGNNASHTYQTAGDFRPSLEVIDQNGCRDFAVDDTVFVTASPIARVTTLNSRISCQSPYTVNFKSNSTGFNLTYDWDFGDGSSSTQENPSHTYNSLGRYDVSLIVSDPNCSDTLLLNEYVILENSTAYFKLPKDTLCVGEEFSPIDSSQGAAIYSWNFGDGTQRNGKNASHTYQDSGYFEITLNVSAGAACTDTYSDSVYVQKVTADFETDTTYTCQPGEVATLAYTGINGDFFEWWIGYPDTSLLYTGDSIFVNQLDTGIFSDTLYVKSTAGCRDTVIKNNNRQVQRLFTEFLANGKAYPTIKDTIGGCSPLEVEFTDKSFGPGIINYWRWSFNEDSSFVQNPTKNFVPDSLYSVTLEIENNLGCKASYQRMLISGFKQNPSFTFYPDSICVLDTLFIVDQSTDASRIDEYTFQLMGSQSNEQLSSIRTSDPSNIFFTDLNETGDFYLILGVVDNGCDTNTTSQNSFHVSGPVSDALADATIDCSDKRIVQFTGNIKEATRFYWDFGDGSPLDSVNENPLHNYPQKMVYRAILTTYNDTNNCAPYKDTIDLNLGSLPPIQIAPDSMEYCLDSKAEFFTADSAIYPFVYWIIDGDTVSTKKKFNTILDERGSFEFKLYAEDALGCPSIDVDTLFVSRPIPKISYEILEACLPMEVIFKDSSFSDTTISSWRWTFDNNDTSYQETDTVLYPNAGKQDISLRVENIFGCADSIFKEDYISTSNFDVNFSQSKVVICEGDSVLFRNMSSGNNIDFTWIFGEDTVESNDINIQHTFNLSDTFNIILIGENELGCKIVENKIEALVVGEKPSANFVADNTVSNCYPFDVNFTDLSSGNVTNWQWKFGDGNSSALQNPFNSYTSLGKFDVSLIVSNDAGCVDSTLKPQYIETNGPSADIQLNKDTACIHEPITFSIVNQQNVENFQWDFGDGTVSNNATASHSFKRTGTVYFTLSIFDSLQICQVVLLDSVHIFEISADFMVNEDTACQPHLAKFTPLSPGASQLNWDFGDGGTSLQNTPTYLYQSPGTFTAELMVNSPLGCKDTAEHEIVVYPKPIAQSHNDTTICFGDTIALWVNGGSSYHWNNEQYLSDDSSALTLAWPDTTTTFQIEVYNQFNCIDTAFIRIEVLPPPIEDPLNISDTSIIIGEYIDLDATAGEKLNYSWRPKEGLNCNNCPTPRAQPLINTTYIVNISDPFGCYNFNDTINIEVIEKYSLEVPNAFSPNGDGNNDIIYAKGWGLKKLIAFKIFNRYGELVFESNDFDKGWDGNYKGKPQNMETYVYTVEAETYSGKVLSRKGNISLLR